MPKIQNTDDTNGSKYVELQELSSIAGGNAVILENSLFLIKLDTFILYDKEITLLGIYSNELQT